MEDDHGAVRWAIKDGLLVARSGRGCGYLSVDVRRLGRTDEGRAKLRIQVEVANFYPSIAVGFSTPVYEMTQSAIHVLVTNNFLRSLAKLNLEQSRVGSLREDALEPGPGTGESAVTNSEGAHLGSVVPGGDPADRP
jgi:hypothetical protein